MFTISQKKTIYDLTIEEINTLARRIINAPTKEIREEHEKKRNKLIGVAEILEKELNINTYN